MINVHLIRDSFKDGMAGGIFILLQLATLHSWLLSAQISMFSTLTTIAMVIACIR